MSWYKYIFFFLLAFSFFTLSIRAQPAAKEVPLRGAWIATVAHIDWPSQNDLTAEQQKQEFIHILDGLQKFGFNAVFVQVRPMADTFWLSKLEPWSYFLTNEQGKDPGYDPLAFMIEQTHQRGMQFHAWFNPYRIKNREIGNMALSSEHPANKHPEWVIDYQGYLMYNPALAEVRHHVTEVVREVVRDYDVDGIHFDDYFYPYPVKKFFFWVPFPDKEDYRASGTTLSRADWRRANVNALVKEIHDMIKQEKPHVQFGISPFGVWRNKRKDPTGSDTSVQFTNYDDIYADTRTWMAEGWIDYILPQLYFPTGYKKMAFETLLAWWKKEVQKYPPVKLYIGIGLYQAGSWVDQDELKKQIQLLREEEIPGEVFYHALNLTNSLPNQYRTRQAYAPTSL